MASWPLSSRRVRVRWLRSRARTWPRLPLATPTVRRAFLPQTTRSPTANWRSPTLRRSAPSWPTCWRSCWQGGLNWSTSFRRGARVATPPPPPPGQEVVLERAGGLGGDQPPVGTVSGQRRVEVAGAEVLDRLALPGLLLAAVAGQLARPQGGPEPAKPPASLDGGQLAIVAD